MGSGKEENKRQTKHFFLRKKKEGTFRAGKKKGDGLETGGFKFAFGTVSHVHSSIQRRDWFPVS